MSSRKNLEFSHRSFVRSFVPDFLKNRSLLFSETLQLVRACKCEKNFPSAVLKKIPVLPILAKNCPKLAKNCPKLAIWLDVCTEEFEEFDNF